MDRSTANDERDMASAGAYAGLVEELMTLDDASLTEEFRSLELQRRRIAGRMAAIVRESERRGRCRRWMGIVR